MQNILTLDHWLISIKKISLNFNLKIFWALGFIFILFLLVFYVFQINALTSEDYQLQSFQKKVNQFSESNKALKVDLAYMNSLENVESKFDKFQELGFEEIRKIHYIQILDGSVVVK